MRGWSGRTRSLGSVVIRTKECSSSPSGRFHVSHSPGNVKVSPLFRLKYIGTFLPGLAERLIKTTGQNQTVTLAEEMLVGALLRQRLGFGVIHRKRKFGLKEIRREPPTKQ